MILISFKIPPSKSFQNILYSPNPVLRPFCLETIVYSPLPVFFLFTLTQSSARSAETFSMYSSFSYGLLQKKGARAARKTFQYIPHFLMDCIRKRPRNGKRNGKLGNIASKTVTSTIMPFYWLTRVAYQSSTDRPRAARRRVRPGRLPPSAKHAPTPAQPPTCTLHLVDINSPRLSSLG